MAKPLKGDVIVVPFPFSDLTQSKRRPALVVAQLEGDDLILCQITLAHAGPLEAAPPHAFSRRASREAAFPHQFPRREGPIVR